MEIWRLLVILLVILLVLLGNSNKLGNKEASQYTTNDKFAVITGTITLTDGSGSTNFNYPTGYNKNNCVPIAAGTIYTSSGTYGFGFVQSSMGTGVIMADSQISLRVNPINGTGATGTYNCKVVLMKTN